jgi:hypothetical protein
MDGSNRDRCDDSALMVCDRDTLLPCLRRVSLLRPLSGHGVGSVAMEHADLAVLRGCTMGHTGDACLPQRPISGSFRSAPLQALGLLSPFGKDLTQGLWTRASASLCFGDDTGCGCVTTLTTRDNCQKNERNGNVDQWNHAYQSSPGLCRL